MKPFSIIVAFDSSYGIGKDGELAWVLPPDLKHFREITCAVSIPGQQNALIMGRHTWESLPTKVRPLPGRYNIMLTKQKGYTLPAGVGCCASLEEALIALPPSIASVFIIGGGALYAQAMEHPLCAKIYVTHVQGDFGCDVFFPPISKQFFLVSASEPMVDGKIGYQFCEYWRHR